MPKESQLRKNAYDTYFPILFAFVASFVLGENKEKKKKKKKDLPASSVFAKSGLRI